MVILSSLLLYGIYIAKETHFSLKLVSAKCHIPNSVLENTRKIKIDKDNKYMINFFPVRCEHVLNLILPIFANILFEKEKRKKTNNKKLIRPNKKKQPKTPQWPPKLPQVCNEKC